MVDISSKIYLETLLKIFKKTLKKVLTKGEVGDIITRLTAKRLA